MNTDVFEQWESNIRGYCRAFPTVFVSASNARQIDESGRSFIDFFAGAGVLNFGHNNARMKKALISFLEADGVPHSLDMYTSAKRDFLEKFVETVLLPRNMRHKMQFIGPTGTNAVEAALKLARRVTGRTGVVAFHHGFHGMTLGSLACTANGYFRAASGVPLEHVDHQPFGCEPHCPGCELGCGMESIERMRARFEDTSSGTAKPAAFIVEAIQAEGGVKVAGKNWLLALQDLARDLGALLIVDDIQAGCGRTGSYFSFDDMGLDPDIICLAKGIGGYGTPLAMNLIKPEHDQHWSPGEHTGTFRGQGFSFVAGREALSYFDDENFLAAVKEKGAQMNNHLRDIAQTHSGENFAVRGKGMMQAIDLNSGELAKTVAARCFEKGLLIGPCGTGGRVIKLMPPLTIPADDLTEGLNILGAAIDDCVEGQ
ncbi:aspartate aminotransferase family protein [Gilvimarinus sp. F26214L]|uniref:aspartate aminotransferase family protein n=1 Tax=Gilvimarinus sp. DZF01 TaxID=3461371 RepID=UPI0040460110